MTHQHSSEPQPLPDSVISGGAGASSSSPPDPAVSVINTSLASSVTGSERTVIDNKKTEDISQGWSNTLDSNMTDTSVEEPKYAKVTHKKRNSKICSGNSTPKVKRRELSGTRLSRLVHLIDIFSRNLTML